MTPCPGTPRYQGVSFRPALTPNVEIWAKELDRLTTGEVDVKCPHCDDEMLVVLESEYWPIEPGLSGFWPLDCSPRRFEPVACGSRPR